MTIKILAGLSALLGLLTLFCTGMIYASLKTIPQWYNWLTPLNYILLGLVSGVLLLACLEIYFLGLLSPAVKYSTLFLLSLGLAGKLLYFLYIGRPRPVASTINTALAPLTSSRTQAQIHLLDAGHSSPTFLTREFVYKANPRALHGLRWLALLLIFVVPTISVLTLSRFAQDVSIVLIVLPMLIGMLCERWLFFAEAQHAVRLYHGQQTLAAKQTG